MDLITRKDLYTRWNSANWKVGGGGALNSASGEMQGWMTETMEHRLGWTFFTKNTKKLEILNLRSS